MSPYLLRRALLIYGPPGICVGRARLLLNEPLHAPLCYWPRRTCLVSMHRGIIRGASTLLPGPL